MYTILVTDSNELVTTVQERIMRRSKLVDKLHFLVPQTYKDLDMSGFTVTMEYVLPISRDYHSETLMLSDELYKEKLEYTVPFDTNLTAEPGDVEVQLTFTQAANNDDGTVTQYVRKTSATTVPIYPISAWSDIVAGAGTGSSSGSTSSSGNCDCDCGDFVELGDDTSSGSGGYNGFIEL